MLRVLTTSFDPTADILEVTAKLHGPSRRAQCNLAVDTGAYLTVVDWNTLNAAGYANPTPLYWTEMIGLSGVELAPVIAVARFDCLDLSRENFEEVCHNLPAEAEVDGLLGLNFFRNTDLRINFKTGVLTLRR